MKNPVLIIGGIIASVMLFIAILVGIFVISPYNSLVTLQVNIQDKTWPAVEAQYQRRYDLIPNMVNTVKGYAAHESDTFKSITRARSAWQGAGSIGEKQAAITGMESAISRLLLTVENYPNLKADTSFLNLQTTLEGTENRITTARIRYNDSVAAYNKKIRTFPSNITAAIFNFEKEEPFKLQDEKAAQPVNVQF